LTTKVPSKKLDTDLHVQSYADRRSKAKGDSEGRRESDGVAGSIQWTRLPETREKSALNRDQTKIPSPWPTLLLRNPKRWDHRSDDPIGPCPNGPDQSRPAAWAAVPLVGEGCGSAGDQAHNGWCRRDCHRPMVGSPPIRISGLAFDDLANAQIHAGARTVPS